jgi:hypothetical protein
MFLRFIGGVFGKMSYAFMEDLSNEEVREGYTNVGRNAVELAIVNVGIQRLKAKAMVLRKEATDHMHHKAATYEEEVAQIDSASALQKAAAKYTFLEKQLHGRKCYLEKTRIRLYKRLHVAVEALSLDTFSRVCEICTDDRVYFQYCMQCKQMSCGECHETIIRTTKACPFCRAEQTSRWYWGDMK